MDVKYLTLSSDSDQEKYHEILTTIEQVTYLPKGEQIPKLTKFKQIVENHKTASAELKQASTYTFNSFIHIIDFTIERNRG